MTAIAKRKRKRRIIEAEVPSRGLFGLQVNRRLREGVVISLLAFSLFVVTALSTHSLQDPGWSNSGSVNYIHNAAGITGAWVGDILFSLFGFIAYLVPIGALFMGVVLYQNKPVGETKSFTSAGVRVMGAFLILISSCGLASLHFASFGVALPMSTGGVIGEGMHVVLLVSFHVIGATILLLAGLCIGLTLFAGVDWVLVLEKIGALTFRVLHSALRGLTYLRDKAYVAGRQLKQQLDSAFKDFSLARMAPGVFDLLGAKQPFAAGAHQKPMIASRTTFKAKGIGPGASGRTGLKTKMIGADSPSGASSLSSKEEDDDSFFASLLPKSKIIGTKATPTKSKSFSAGGLFGGASSIFKTSLGKEAAPAIKQVLPSLDLLSSKTDIEIKGYSKEQLEFLSELVEKNLLEFGAKVQVVAIYPGPVITRFELALAPGLKVSKITGLAKDLARALSVTSVRVVEVIPGKSYIGLEIPNKEREMVYLREILESQSYEKIDSPLALALGKDISGEPVTANLAKMPHLLVAGTTGAGKSVGLNAMLLSMLYKASPDVLRLILIDPKMLELAIYEGIPHLLTPVVTDMKDAAQALRWCVAEMERRYQLMSMLGVRQLAGYNKKIQDANQAGEPIYDPLWPEYSQEPAPALEAMPYIVVVIDEFADMIMVVGKKVEELIARIAQKARAAGIHLILATQRPSVDVITGLIKANIPTRIAFQVSSRIDSRTILDQQGAEQLLGHGDMLFLPPGVGIPMRIHGAYVADEEVHKVVAYLKASGGAHYIQDIWNVTKSDSSSEGDDDPEDELYDQAVRIVTESKRASISHVQRRLKIGYNRAARLIEHMEHQGVVSEMQSNGSREVLAGAPPDIC